MSGNFPNNLNSANSFPCGAYGPFGVNDNNFNRQQIPSNLYPFKNGTGNSSISGNTSISGNPFGNFNPLTTNTQQSMGRFTKFNQSYVENEPMIEKITYKNQNNLIHNNVNENVLDENIVEYRVYIDSLDRDVKTYPNPFNFTVNFNATSQAVIRDVYYAGTPGPVINKDFRNVKYVKLETIVLPQYSNYTKCDGKYVPNVDSYLPDDRFLILTINELEECNNIYTTADSGTTNKYTIPNKPFGLILPDSKYGRVYYSGTTYTAQRYYNNSTLGNINKLTLRLYDSVGKLLGYNHLLKPEQLENDSIDVSDIRHPLNKNLQIHYTFVIGVVEPHINNTTKYEK